MEQIPVCTDTLALSIRQEESTPSSEDSKKELSPVVESVVPDWVKAVFKKSILSEKAKVKITELYGAHVARTLVIRDINN